MEKTRDPREMFDEPKRKTRTKLDTTFTFDVTCVIGTVVVDGSMNGERPDIVAMKLIAEHDAEGTYSFPLADGRTQIVTVDRVASVSAL